MRSSALAVAVLGCLVVVCAACSRQRPEPPQPEVAEPRPAPELAPSELGPAAERLIQQGRTMIPVCFASRESVYSHGLRESMAAEAARLGFEMVFDSAGRSVERQKTMVRRWARPDTAGIVIEPIDMLSAPEVIGAAQGLPVVTLGAPSAFRGAVNVAPDYALMGRLAADRLYELMPKRPSVLIMEDGADVSARRLVEAFVQAGREYDKAVTTRHDCRGQAALARELTAMVVAQDPVDGVFAVSDRCALGAAEALEAAGHSSAVVIGFGDTPEARAALDSGGVFKATINPGYDQLGVQAVRALIGAAAGRADRIELPAPSLVDAENQPPGRR